jgi:MSHA pilin protein MshC
MPRRGIRPALHRAPAPRRTAGFTMVELIVVIILIGILSAIGVGRFFNRSGYDAAAFAEQGRGMLRYAQKLAIAQNRPVYVQGDLFGVALCFSDAVPCPVASQVPAPSGSNTGSVSTRSRCKVGSVYYERWYCEGFPVGVSMTPGSGALPLFFFNGLGQPGVPGGTFADLTVSISADGSASAISIAAETGYVN